MNNNYCRALTYEERVYEKMKVSLVINKKFEVDIAEITPENLYDAFIVLPLVVSNYDDEDK